jgi:hypothetical protein
VETVEPAPEFVKKGLRRSALQFIMDLSVHVLVGLFSWLSVARALPALFLLMFLLSEIRPLVASTVTV